MESSIKKHIKLIAREKGKREEYESSLQNDNNSGWKRDVKKPREEKW